MPHPETDRSTAWRSEPPPPGLGDVAAVAAWSLALMGFFWNVVALRQALFYFDITEINFPYRDFLAQELRSGRFARWHPGLYCGLPLYSESQAGYLHPLKYLLYPWMASWKAFNLDTVLSVWLTGLGTYGWLRRHVGPRGALAGAGVFGLGGFVWAHLIHTSMNNALTSVPFVIWAAEAAWDGRRTAGIALGAFAIACQVFAGHLQDTLFTVALIGLYTVYRAWTETDGARRLHTSLIGGSVIGLGVILAAVQWIPSKELLDRSPRAGGLTWSDLTYGSWHPELLPTLVVREAYGTRARDTDWMDGFYPYHEMNAYLGLTALALAVIGAGASRDRWAAFWVLLALVGGVLMLGRFTFLFDVAHRIPVIGSSRIPVRFHLWVSLAVAALAGVGVDRLERGFPVKLRGPGLLVGLMIVASLPILLYVYLPAMTHPERWTNPYHLSRFEWLGRQLTASALRGSVLLLIGGCAITAAAKSTNPRLRQAAASLLPCVVIADLLGSHWDDVPSVDPAYWTTPPASAAALAADPTVLRIYGIAEKSAGEPGYASEPIDFLPVRDTLDWSLPPVWGLKTSRGETPIIPRRMLAFTDNASPNARFDLQSVSHFVGSRRRSLPLGKGVRTGEALIYTNDRVLPRARLVGRPVYVANEQEAAATVKRLGEQIREQIIVEDPDRPLQTGSPASGDAAIRIDEPEHLVIETRSDSPAYLTLSDTYDPGWSATIDGRAATIRPAWLAFRAVFLPPGTHTVEMRYTPAGFGLGRALSLAGLTLLLGLIGFPRRLPALTDAHAELAWRPGWPLWGLAVVAGIVAVSAVGLREGGGLEVNRRWNESFHQFTWGAGIEAMNRKPVP